jgi:hypothetical protein
MDEARSTWLALALILASAAAVRLLSFRGYTSYDAAEYTRLAHMMLSGEFKIGMPWFIPSYPARLGLLAPVALAFRVGGVNEVTLAAYPFLLSMLGILVAYLAAKAMFGVRAGLVAACLAALIPIDVLFASVLLPDMPAAFWMNAGVLLVYAGSRQETVYRASAFGTLAGLALFASWLCKESVLYLLPFMVVYLLWVAIRDRRNLALLLAGIVTASFLVAIEGWMYHRYAGGYLFRYHVIAGGADRTVPIATLTGLTHYLAYRVSEVLKHTLLNVYFAFAPAAALVACGYATFRRSRRFLFPGLWFGWLLLMFGFGSASPAAYRPLALFMIRYQYPMLLPAILLVAGLIGSLLSPLEPNESGKRHRVRLMCGVLVPIYLLGVSLVMLAWGIRSGRDPDSMGLHRRAEKEMSRVLKPTDPLYTDPHTALALEFFWQFPAADSTYDFEGMDLPRIPSGAYVLLNRDEIAAMRYNFRYRPPEFFDDVPPAWRKLVEMDNATLYRVPPGPVCESARQFR